MNQLTEQDVIRIIKEQFPHLAEKPNVYQKPFDVNKGAPSPLTPFLSHISNGPSGVLSSTNIGSSIVNKNPATNNTNAPSFTFPIPIINATSGIFNGGTAPNGTMLVYINGTKRQLWIRFYSDTDGAEEWYGMDFSPGHTNSAVTVLGPIA